MIQKRYHIFLNFPQPHYNDNKNFWKKPHYAKFALFKSALNKDLLYRLIIIFAKCIRCFLHFVMTSFEKFCMNCQTFSLVVMPICKWQYSLNHGLVYTFAKNEFKSGNYSGSILMIPVSLILVLVFEWNCILPQSYWTRKFE